MCNAHLSFFIHFIYETIEMLDFLSYLMILYYIVLNETSLCWIGCWSRSSLTDGKSFFVKTTISRLELSLGANDNNAIHRTVTGKVSPFDIETQFTITSCIVLYFVKSNTVFNTFQSRFTNISIQFQFVIVVDEVNDLEIQNLDVRKPT